jgi:phosphohistidine phosphatase
MNIYLVRHSEAEPTSQLKKDSERELTQVGTKLIESAATRWKPFITNFEYIFTSPFKRAVQTAEIIASVTGTKNEIIIDKSLSPGSNAEAIILISNTFEADEIVFVGHQPDISFIISQFISSYDVNLKISPVTICKISFKGKPKPGKGKLEFLFPPPK